VGLIAAILGATLAALFTWTTATGGADTTRWMGGELGLKNLGTLPLDRVGKPRAEAALIR
jgi:hypothetical protein